MILEDTSGAAFVLESLLQPCFGPDGLTVLLESFDGHVTSVHSGCHLVTSINYAKPVGQLVVQAVKQLYKVSGDGSKKFILMLAAALRELKSLVHEKDVYALGRHGQVLTELSAQLTHTVIPSLATSQQSCLLHELKENTTGEQLVDMCRSLAETCMGNKVALGMKQKMLEIVSALLFPCRKTVSVGMLKTRTEYILANFEEVCTYVPNTPATGSKTVPGFILERDFIVTPPSLPLKNFTVALLLTGLELDGDDATYHVDSARHLSSIVCEVAGFKERLIQSLADRGVRLVLSAKKIDPVSAQHLRKHSMGAIQMVPEETLRYIAETCGTQPIQYSSDLFERSSLIPATGCSYEFVGNSRKVNLQCEAVGPADDHTHTSLLLAGATLGQCQQHGRALQEILKVLTAWCREDGDKRALRGGGAWELGVARELERRLRCHEMIRGGVEWTVCKALQSAFLAIPLTLLKNTSSPQSRDNLKQLHMLMGNEAMKTGAVPLGVDIQTGCLQPLDDLCSSSVWEPYWSQVTLVHSVCILLKNILRIDTVTVTSRSLASLRQEDDGCDSEDDDD